MLTIRILSDLAKKAHEESNMTGFVYKNDDGTVTNGHVIEICMKQRLFTGR